jgi:nitrite reductase (NADH) small subunit
MSTSSEARVVDLGPVGRIPPGEGRNVEVDGEEIAVFRTRSGEVYAVQATCPHRGGPLADGIVGGGRVVCPMHAYAFDLATGEANREGCPALRTYPVTLGSSGEILLTVPEPAAVG